MKPLTTPKPRPIKEQIRDLKGKIRVMGPGRDNFRQKLLDELLEKLK